MADRCHGGRTVMTVELVGSLRSTALSRHHSHISGTVSLQSQWRLDTSMLVCKCRSRRLSVCLFVTCLVLIRFYVFRILHVFPSVLWHCWLGDRKGIRPVKKDYVCWWWWFDWSFARPIAPAVTATSGILCFNKHRLTQVHLENGR